MKTLLLALLIPAAAGAKTLPIFPPIRVAPPVNSVIDNRTALLRLLDHPDPQVQLNALRSLRYYVGQTADARWKVLSVLEDSRRARPVRYQAIKTLSWAANYPDVRDRLMFYANHPMTAPDFKAMHMKALYTRAAGDPTVRGFLMRRMATEMNPVARMGAIWALGEASHYPDTAAALMRLAVSAPTPAMQDAAVRSLYRGNGRPETWNFVNRAVRGELGLSMAARVSAVRLAGTMSGFRQGLMTLAANPRMIDPRLNDADARTLSAAATQALAGDRAETLRYFHRAYPGWDPLDTQ
jgi:hypothetical protein